MGKQRNRVFSVRFSDEELRILNQLAQEKGQSVGGTIRWLVQRELEEKGKLETLTQQVNELILKVDNVLVQVAAEDRSAETATIFISK